MPRFRSKNFDSPARLRLGELLESRQTAIAQATEVQARVSRLAVLATAADQPRAALARLDAAEAQAFAAWAASSPDSPPPTPDSAARASLQREIAEAEAKSGAAQRAVDGMAHESATAAQKVASINAGIPLAAAQAALEICPVIANETREAVAAFHDAKIRVGALRQIFTIAQQKSGPTAPGYSEFTAELVAASQAMNEAAAIPDDTGWESAFVGAVNDFMGRLTSDAGAQFEPPARNSGQGGVSAGIRQAIAIAVDDRALKIRRAADEVRLAR